MVSFWQQSSSWKEAFGVVRLDFEIEKRDFEYYKV